MWNSEEKQFYHFDSTFLCLHKFWNLFTNMLNFLRYMTMTGLFVHEINKFFAPFLLNDEFDKFLTLCVSVMGFADIVIFLSITQQISLLQVILKGLINNVFFEKHKWSPDCKLIRTFCNAMFFELSECLKKNVIHFQKINHLVNPSHLSVQIALYIACASGSNHIC